MEHAPEPLLGGNSNSSVVRIGDLVRRQAGPWTRSVHALLAHLEAAGFPAPRVRGQSGDTELLTYIEGEVVHPDHYVLIANDQSLTELFAMIRQFHELAAGFTTPAGTRWHTLGADPSGASEVLCHNDFAPWNLVWSAEGWVFIDWDLVAPGRRDWELAWSLLSLVPLLPRFQLPAQEVGHRIAVSLRAYGVPPAEWPRLMDVILERTRHSVTEIHLGAGRGEEPFVSLLAGGHADTWQEALDHVGAQGPTWLARALGDDA